MKKYLPFVFTAAIVGIIFVVPSCWMTPCFPERKMEITDAYVERVSREIYIERHKREPEIYHWATWEDFIASPEGAARVPVWRSDIKLGVEVITRIGLPQ